MKDSGNFRNICRTDQVVGRVPRKIAKNREVLMNKNTFAREAKWVEFTARHLWRFLRPFVRGCLSRRCKNCVLPETAAPLDENGLCGACKEYLANPSLRTTNESSATGPDPIDAILKEAAGRAQGPYDALLLFSGGKDSTYLLHRLRTTYPGLRLLTVLVDNGFLSPFALENAERVLRRFDVAHLTSRPPPSFVKKAFHYALTNLDKQTGYSIVDLMDGHIIFDTAKNLAVRMEIPLVLCGLSKVQAENALGLFGFEFPPEKEREKLVAHEGLPLRGVFTEQEMQNWFDGSQVPPERIPRFIFPYYVWDVGEKFILQEVSRLGLLDEQHRSPLLTNNKLIPVIGMAESARFGFSSFEIEYARMVREGKSARGHWLNLFEMLEYATKTGRFINESVVETLAQLGLTKEAIGIGRKSRARPTQPKTLIDAVLRRAQEAPDAPAFFHETSQGWKPHANAQFRDDILTVAAALHERGVAKGDRVAVMAHPCYEWEVADKAVMYLGGITVGLDCRSGGSDLDYLLEKAGVRGLFVENSELLEQIPAKCLAQVAFVCVFDAPPTNAECLSFKALISGKPTSVPLCRTEPEDIGAIIFTSGTTGRAKGIPLRQRQLASAATVMREAFARELQPGEKTLAWFSPGNGTGRMLGSLFFELGVVQYFVKDPRTLFDKIKEVNPTFMVVVPRILEKTYSETRRRLNEKPWFARWGFGVLLMLRTLLPFSPVVKITDWLLLGKIRKAVWGSGLRLLFSGTASADPKILRWFQSLGVPTCEGYGLSEIGNLVAVNRPEDIRYGSVGRPLPTMEVSLAADGEILVKSPATLDHYWGEEAGELFDDAGRLKTGDVGRIEGGRLYITGRKKELIKTSTGRRISPVEVERHYQDIPGIQQFIVVGNGRKHLSALVFADQTLQTRLAAEQNGLDAYVAREIEKRGKRLAEDKQIRKFAVLTKPISVEDGELTSTLKVRRMEIERRYRQLINSLYPQEAS
jgi:long-chain acyl-CoA synthetase